MDGFRVRDGHHPSTGSTALDLLGATEVSCNIYYALTGLQTGGADLVAYADRMGFDAAIPFDLPTAVSQVTGGDGNEPGGFRDDVELANASYGQAETFVTPLQMALVAATVANGGELMRPRLVTADLEQEERDANDRRRRRWAGSSRRPTRRPSTRRWSRRSRVRSAVSSRPGPRCRGVTTAGKSGHRRAGRQRRAPLVVHRVRAGRGAEGRHRGPRRAGRSRCRGRGADRRRPDGLST